MGNIVAGEPMPIPGSDFSYYDPDSGIDIARSLLPAGDKPEDLYALKVHGDSMIDAMVNDGDIVIMKKVNTACNGEMVAVWLNDREETTLKYFYLENGRVRLQPANPSMQPIYINDPRVVEVVATGNVFVMGSVRGRVCAGCKGNRESYIIAMDFEPVQLRIADKVAISPSAQGLKRELRTQKAFIEGDSIVVVSVR